MKGMNRLLLVTSGLLAFAAVTLMLCGTQLDVINSETGAKLPNARTGQVYQVDEHGYISYVTRRQRDNVRYAFAGVGVCFALAVAIDYVRRKKLERRGSVPTGQMGQVAGYPSWLPPHSSGNTTNGTVGGRFRRWLDAEWPMIKPLAILMALFMLIVLIQFSGRWESLL